MSKLRNIQEFVTSVVNYVRYPPFSPALALNVAYPQPSSSTSTSFLSPFVYFKTTDSLFGVPKYRTCKPKKMTKKFGFPKLLMYNINIVTCKTCGDSHQLHSVCGTCYSVIAQQTEEIKKDKLGLHKSV